MMRALVRNVVLGLLIGAAAPMVAAAAGGSTVTASAQGGTTVASCPLGTNWDAISQSCK